MARALCIGVAVLVLGLMSSTAFAQGAHFGKWKANEAKSKRDPSVPAPQSAMRTYEPFEGDGIKLTIATITAGGTRRTGGYSVHFDGKDYPTTGNPNFNTVSLKRIDDHTFESTLKKDGKVVETVRNTVSKDGKTMTTTSKGTNTKGQPYTEVLVWDKQ